MKLIMISLACFLLLPFNVILAEEEKEKEFSQSGTLAFSSGLPKGDYKLDTWGDVNIQDDVQNPLVGRVSKKSANEYQYTVSNKSEDHYSATVSIVQYNKNNKKLHSFRTGVSLQGGASITRSIRANPNAVSVQLELLNWKSKKRKPSKAEMEEDLEAKKSQIKELESALGIEEPKAPKMTSTQ